MKKILSFVLGGLLIASTVFTASAANVSDFSDMPNDWSTTALTAAVDNGLLTGSDGKILPADNLTRAQMATIISRAFGATSKAPLDGFTDVPASAWYYEYMQKAVAMGVFAGDGSGLLTPENNITREQVFTVLARAFKLENGDASVLDKFTDKGDISSWATGFTAALVSNGYVNGSNGRLNPKSNITRAEFAQIMYNMVKTYIDSPKTLTGTYRGNIVIRSSDVSVLSNATIDGILIICESCENVEISTAARIKNTVDNRPKAETPEDNKETTDSGNKNNSTGDIFWVVEDNNGGNSSETLPDIEYEEDEEGWSGIYRP